MKYINCLSLYATQIIVSFLNSRTLAHHDKVERPPANGEIQRGLFLYCRISFNNTKQNNFFIIPNNMQIGGKVKISCVDGFYSFCSEFYEKVKVIELRQRYTERVGPKYMSYFIRTGCTIDIEIHINLQMETSDVQSIFDSLMQKSTLSLNIRSLCKFDSAFKIDVIKTYQLNNHFEILKSDHRIKILNNYLNLRV